MLSKLMLMNRLLWPMRKRLLQLPLTKLLPMAPLLQLLTLPPLLLKLQLLTLLLLPLATLLLLKNTQPTNRVYGYKGPLWQQGGFFVSFAP
jgi:hypothetical protein